MQVTVIGPDGEKHVVEMDGLPHTVSSAVDQARQMGAQLPDGHRCSYEIGGAERTAGSKVYPGDNIKVIAN